MQQSFSSRLSGDVSIPRAGLDKPEGTATDTGVEASFRPGRYTAWYTVADAPKPGASQSSRFK